MNPQEASANKSYNITTNTATVITGKKVLIRIIVNTRGASSNTLAIYDSANTTENLKGTIDTTVSVGSIEYGIPMYNGIYIVTATGTAPNVTIVYSDTP